MPWKKGQSGNPSGRPRKFNTFVSQMLARLAVLDPDTGEVDPTRSRAYQLAERLWNIALEKENKDWLRAAQTILDRVEGLPIQPVSLSLTGPEDYAVLSDDELDELIEAEARLLESGESPA